MGRSLGDRYRVDEPVGRGPHGVVYAGVDGDGGRFAFKTLREDLGRDPDLAARYLQIENTLRGLDATHLVRTRELVVADGAATMVGELVAGENLRTPIEANGPMLPSEVARIGAGIAAGLAALHRSGLVHGDVKPENVLLDESSSLKVPRLSDIALARTLGMPRSGHGTPSLTDPRYLAPELANGAAATPASDLYALGIILYELCCGVPPFVGGTAFGVLRQHVELEPGRPDGIPDPLWQVSYLLLAKNPHERQQNAHEIAVVLEHMVAELMPTACASRLTTPPPGKPSEPAPLPPNPGPPPPSIAAGMPFPFVASSGGPLAKKRKRKMLVAVTTVVLVTTGLIVWLADSGSSSPNSAPPNQPVVATATTTGAVQVTTDSPTSTAPTTAPNLVGKTIDQAQDSLPSSIKVTTRDMVDTTHAGGTVIAQDPPAGQPLNGTMQLTVARSPEIVYLDSLTPADGSWSQADSNAQLGGQTMIHSVIGDVSGCSDSSTQTVEYNLSKGYRKFQATAGVDDQSPDSGMTVNMQIFGDNRQLSSDTISFGKPTPISVDVSGVLRLKIQFQPVSTGSCYQTSYFDLGTAQLQGLPGEVPASVDPNSSSEPPTG